MALLLKILSGPHQGAEFDIPEHTITIGAANDCDVVLSDLSLKDHHVKIAIKDNNIEITSVDGMFYVDGKPQNESVIVEVFQFIHLGSTLLMFGDDKDEKWNQISASDAPALQINDGEKTEEDAATVIPTIDTEKEINDQPANESVSLHKKVSGIFWKYTLRFFFLLAIALVISTSYVLYRDQPDRPKQQSKPVPVDTRIQNIVDNMKIENKLNISHNDVGQVSVIGYVSTMEQSAKLKSEIRKITDNASIKIYSVEKIMNSCKEIILKSKHDIRLTPGAEFGHFQAKGFVYKVNEWEDLKEELLAVKGVIKIKDEVFTKVNAATELKTVLTENGFGKLLEPKVTPQGMQIVGTITDKDRLAWDKAREAIEKTFKKIAKIDFVVNVTTDRNMTVEKFFGGPIDSVSYSEEGLDWVNIKNGNKYFQGSVLPSGYIVSDITKKSITIKNADEVLTIDLDWI